MWKHFLEHPAVYCKPFLDFSKDTEADTINMYSDASRNFKLGYGATCNALWMHGLWDESFMEQNEPSIAYLELFALTAGVLTWIHRYRNRRVTLFCDNQSIVSMINTNSSACKHCMILIRMLVLKCMVENVRVFIQYVPSKQNLFADLLSRNKIKCFRDLGKNKFENRPTRIPEELWLMQKVWSF